MQGNQFIIYTISNVLLGENGSFITKGKKVFISFINKQEYLKQYPEIMPVIGGKENQHSSTISFFKEEIEFKSIYRRYSEVL